MSDLPDVVAVVLAYGEDPTLETCIRALVQSAGVDLEVVVVDNGGDAALLSELATWDRVRVVGPPINRGFAGGCNYGAANSTASSIVLVNSDAFVSTTAVSALVAAARDPEVGIASASLRLDDEPELMNSAGNPVHFSGMTWSGRFRAPATECAIATDVASATGAAMALRRDVWELLGGFNEDLFAYLEDTELSLRVWQAGLRVRYVPEAVVTHRYEFSRRDSKFYLLERNRLLVVLTLYQVRTLVVLAPILLFFEAGILVQAVAGGWGRAKVRGWWWIIRHARRSVLMRRRTVGATRTVSDGAWVALLESHVAPDNVETPPGMRIVNAVLGGYWAIARRALAR